MVGEVIKPGGKWPWREVKVVNEKARDMANLFRFACPGEDRCDRKDVSRSDPACFFRCGERCCNYGLHREWIKERFNVVIRV